MLRLVTALFLALCGVANAQLAGGLQFPGPGMPASSGAATCASVLPNLLINLDASDSASVIRSGANVSAWNGSSGTSINFAGVNNPQYSATGWPGSLPQISFLNSSSRYFTASTTLSTTTLSVFVVAREGGNVQFGGYVSILGSGQSNDFGNANSLAFSNNSSNRFALITRNSGNFAISSLGTGTITTGGVTFDGTNGRGYSNFSLTAGPTASTGTFGNGTTQMAIGARLSSGPSYGTFLTGDVAEIIVTTGAVSGGDLTTLQSCLQTKWGVP